MKVVIVKIIKILYATFFCCSLYAVWECITDERSENEDHYWMHYFYTDPEYSDWAYKVIEKKGAAKTETAYEILRTGAHATPEDQRCFFDASDEILYDLFKATRVAQQ